MIFSPAPQFTLWPNKEESGKGDKKWTVRVIDVFTEEAKTHAFAAIRNWCAAHGVLKGFSGEIMRQMDNCGQINKLSPLQSRVPWKWGTEVQKELASSLGKVLWSQAASSPDALGT